MKILGRILIILIVFSIITGSMVTAVNASGINAPDFNGAPQFRSDDDGGFRPEREEREGGGSWMFGAIKNIAVVGFLVTVIVWPKSVAKKKRKSTAVNRKS